MLCPRCWGFWESVFQAVDSRPFFTTCYEAGVPGQQQQHGRANPFFPCRSLTQRIGHASLVRQPTWWLYRRSQEPLLRVLQLVPVITLFDETNDDTEKVPKSLPTLFERSHNPVQPRNETRCLVIHFILLCSMWNHRPKEMARTGLAGVVSLLQSIQCSQVSFSSIDNCVTYNY
jgi:hypothetical protein